MQSLNDLSEKNSLIKQMLIEGDISLARLKKIYHRLCKLTHPDLTKETDHKFIKLREEYEEAKANFEVLRSHFKTESSQSLLEPEEIKILFYEALRHYLAAGLASSRMRLRFEVKNRNELILRDVIKWAKLYKPSFIEPFLKYNRIYYKRFPDWQKQSDQTKAQQLLLYAIYNTIDFVINHSPQSLRAVRSYLSDCASYLHFAKASASAKALQALCTWFKNEIEYLALQKTLSKTSRVSQFSQEPIKENKPNKRNTNDK